MEKFKGYEVVDKYPEDGWLKGYFYAVEEDLKSGDIQSKKAYRDIGAIRHKDYLLHLLNVKKEEKILDVGCEVGAMMVYTGLLGAEVCGIDIDPGSVKRANLYLEKYGIKGRAVIGDARHLEFPDNSFDKVVSSDFLEHMDPEDNISVFQEIKRVLKPGGIAVIKTPNLTYLKCSRYFKMLKRLLQCKNPFSVVIPHTRGYEHQHIGLLTKGRLMKVIQAAGFLNFNFHYDINSKIERVNYFLGEFLACNPFLRNIFSEELIILIRKPVIVSFFPQ